MNTTVLRSALSLAALAALGSLSPAAEAFELHRGYRSNIEWARPHLRPDLVPNMMSTADIQAIEDAADAWNEALPKVSFHPVIGDRSYAVGNYDSEVAMVCDDFLTAGEDAATWRIYDPIMDWMLEADTYVNLCTGGGTVAPTTDHTDRVAYGGSELDLTSLMVQHFGRQLGLDPDPDAHNTSAYAQTAVGFHDDTAHAYVSADDVFGAVALYGTGHTSEQVGLSHFKWTSESRTTDELAFTEVYDVEGRLRPSSWSDGIPRYLVFEGGELQVEFTMEGLGNAAGMIELEFYLSSNTTITADDTLLGSTMTFAPMGQAITMVADLTIPDEQPSGDYAIGIVATAQGTETALDNNTTVLLVEVSDANTTCTPSSPCDHREGDCDSDADCVTGTVCKHNVGAKYGASRYLDVCEYPTWDLCTPEFPCASGEGDCDSNSDCISGVCQHDVGTSYGYSSASLDVCR